MTYTPHPHHRDGRVTKSQWTIGVPDEIACFEHAGESGWLMGAEGWGLHAVNGSVTWLGLSAVHRENLFIAKFVDGTVSDEWHGYPADHCRNTQDIPHEEVLLSWLKEEMLSPAKVRKVMRGQRCSP